MLCERCQQRDATVYMKQQIPGAGQIQELRLCEQCAAVTALESPISFKDFLKGIMDMVTDIEKEYSGNHTQFGGSAAAKPVIKCKSCGLTYDEFRQGGKFGCFECYGTFRQRLEQLFKNVHGAVIHTGKLPHRLSADLLAKRELDTLRNKLARAIESEEFEEAALLRDSIRRVEADNVNKTNAESGAESL